MPRVLEDLNKKPEFLSSGIYSIKQKKIISKILYGFGWGSPSISKWLNISRGTVLKANKQPTPKNLISFELGFKEEILKMNCQTIYQIKQRIIELVPQEKDINKLVTAGEYFQNYNQTVLG